MFASRGCIVVERDVGVRSDISLTQLTVAAVSMMKKDVCLRGLGKGLMVIARTLSSISEIETENFRTTGVFGSTDGVSSGVACTDVVNNGGIACTDGVSNGDVACTDGVSNGISAATGGSWPE